MEARVFDEDYTDPVKNQKRFVLLKHQWGLLCPMPKGTKWYKAKTERNDLTKLRVINEATWNVLSDGEGTIIKAIDNF